MYIKTDKGRDYYECGRCKKPYSFRTGKTADYWMKNYCAECRRKARALIDRGW